MVWSGFDQNHSLENTVNAFGSIFKETYFMRKVIPFSYVNSFSENKSLC